MNLPYIIAEIGLNHYGWMQTAERMVWEAAHAGANAAKFQAVWADKLVSKTAPTYFAQEPAYSHIAPTGAPRVAATQHEFFSRSDTISAKGYEHLAGVCAKAGIDFLCTPFDVETVEWLNPLVPAFKIASADITNVPLLEAVASHGKPVYLSTGASTDEEIYAALRILRRQDEGGSPLDVTLLHCVLSYPTRTEDANLGAICDLPGTSIMGHGRGYSDHTLFNLDVLTTAWLLGATVIEKHFTLDKTLPGNDHYHSMDPNDLRALVAKFKELQAMIGDGEKRVLPCEEAARLNARQSWHATKALRPGDIIHEGDVVLKRPGTGAPASFDPLGWTLLVDVAEDEPIPDPVSGRLSPLGGPQADDARKEYFHQGIALQ